MEKHDNFFERLAHERNISVKEMKKIIFARIEKGLHDPDPEKRKSWEDIPCKSDALTPEEWLRYAVEKLESKGQEDFLRRFMNH